MKIVQLRKVYPEIKEFKLWTEIVSVIRLEFLCKYFQHL